MGITYARVAISFSILDPIDRQRVFSHNLYCFLLLLFFEKYASLSDAEVGKYVVKNFLTCDGVSRNLTQSPNCIAEVSRKEVARESFI